MCQQNLFRRQPTAGIYTVRPAARTKAVYPHAEVRHTPFASRARGRVPTKVPISGSRAGDRPPGTGQKHQVLYINSTAVSFTASG